MKLRTYQYILLAILLPSMVSITSCTKKFLTDKPYTSLLTTDAVKSESDLLAILTGNYSNLRATDLYGRTLPVRGDLMADNTFVITANSGRYIQMNTFTQTKLDAFALGVWQNAYIGMKNADFIINNASKATPSANVNQYVGEAYAIRALMLFELVRNFSNPYTVSSTGIGVPIILDFNRDTIPARSSIKDVYTQVISDLEKAYSLMTVYRGSSYFSKYSARALEARVYQTMGDWPNSLTTSLDVVSASGAALLDSAAYLSYWASPTAQASTKNETLFEVESDAVTNNQFDQIGFIYLAAGGGYGDILATPDLFNIYAPNDVRKRLILAGTRSGQNGTAYLCQKYVNAANTADKDDTKVLRLSDIILIAAEAYYNASDFPNANKYLNMVAQKRDKTIAPYANTGAQVLEDILTERRKELAFEGSRFWDLLRLQRSYTKVVNQNPAQTIAVTPSNFQLVFPIPKTEMDANPNMKQNPSY
jgi:hypothetical protein